MFTLLNGFYEELTYVPEHRIAILGIASSGKTCLLEAMKQALPPKSNGRALTDTSIGGHKESIAKLSEEKISSVTSTVGLNVARLPTGYEKLLVWDLGGAESLRSIWKRYATEAEALIWVVDASDPEAMEESRKCLQQVLKHENLTRAPLLVYATKQDAESALDPVKTSLRLDLLSDAEMRPQCVQPASVKTGRGVLEGLQWLVHRLRNPADDVKTSIKGT